MSDRPIAKQPFDGYADSRARLIALLNAMRPERSAGEFPRDDGTVEFYTRVNALISPAMTLVDYGAGRGRQFDVPDAGYLQALQKLQGKVARVIGIDVNAAIRDHPFLDERHIVSVGAPLPVLSGTVDMVVADWVLEHLQDPAQFVREMERLVVPGGWICARTVNRWGYVGIGARIVPNRLHGRVVRRLITVAKTDDVFPTVYRLNTLSDTRRWFSSRMWENCSYLANTTPRYFANSKLLFRAIDLYQRIVPNLLRTDLFVFMRRK